MLVWFDQQWSPATARWLKQRFTNADCFHVRNLGLRHASDRAIFEAARTAGAVVVTKDRDFKDLSESRQGGPQIVWLTCGNTSNARLSAIFEAVWPRVVERLEEGERVVVVRDESSPD